jgi:uncharacterized protein (TIGR03437 family)
MVSRQRRAASSCNTCRKRWAARSRRGDAGGTAGGATNLSKAAAAVNVLVGGLPATVSYAGLAPLYPGLYQLNVVVPADLAVSATGPVPLAVQTSDSFHDQVDLIVSP